MGGNENGYRGDGFCVLILNFFFFLKKKKKKKKRERDQKRPTWHVPRHLRDYCSITKVVSISLLQKICLELNGYLDLNLLIV
jgi:hypothetical protein